MSAQQKVFVLTQGCQMNVYDSDKMVSVLNMERTQNPEEAAVILLNTCSVRERAQEKVFSELGQFRKLKEENPALIIGVGGCVASQEGKAIISRAPFVDLIFGPQTLHRLPEMIKQRQKQTRAVVDVSFPEIEKFDHLPAPKADGPTAFVSIMEGCSKYCTYCIVPYTRGEEISRPLDDVLLEVAQLAEQGVVEVTLLGQNVNDYRGTTHEAGTADLADLIHYIAAMDGIQRIRYTTSHPTAFSQRLIDAYRDVPKLANQLHLPVQSGSNRILAMMKRGYKVEEYIEKMQQLKAVRSDITISSDFIVGFPSETEEDFMATMDLVAEIGFDNSFSFIYSARPGTPAAKLHDGVEMAVKKERLQRLQDRILQQAGAISREMIGTTQQVLITGRAKKQADLIAGRTENNRVVNLVGDLSLVGSIIPVRITEALPNSLRGEQVSSSG